MDRQYIIREVPTHEIQTNNMKKHSKNIVETAQTSNKS